MARITSRSFQFFSGQEIKATRARLEELLLLKRTSEDKLSVGQREEIRRLKTVLSSLRRKQSES